ncbi:9035_t:CDS:2 [Ambispora leptoticha]|uniref:9035_t:CDS:1 n=1 Tax=Ambispora leptoticha TaxID=144679 RepID=A0A9N8W5A0_9GLOM|nr:9035_t:CDS:2 [Ambispora leptoticha]
MEKPTISVYTAAHTVDYLGHSHEWTETEVVYTFAEVKKELAAFKSKCREEHETDKYLAIVAKHEEIERRKAIRAQRKQLQQQNAGNEKSEASPMKTNANPFSSATPLVEKRVNAAGQTVTKKVKDPLKKLQREEWLQEKRLLRQENAIWRRMGVVKSGRLVSPQSLNWQKESDVLWLFGPLYQPEEEEQQQNLDEDEDTKSSTIDGIPNYTSPIKPALKKHVEHSPIEDLLTYYKCSKVLNKDKSVTSVGHPYNFDAAEYSSSSEESDVTDAEDSDSGSSSDSSTGFPDHSQTRRNTMPVRIPKNKKSLRFSSKLEQVHYYAPTNYTKPPTRRRSTKKNLIDEDEDEPEKIPPKGGAGVAIGIKGVGMMDSCNDYNQIFKWAKSQVKDSGSYSLFCEDKKGASIVPDNSPIAAYQATMDAIAKKTAAASHMTTDATTNGAMEYQKMLAAARVSSMQSTTRRRQSTQYSKPIYDAELLSDDDDDESFSTNNKKSSNKTVDKQEKEVDPFCPPPVVEDLDKDASKNASIVARCVNIAENAKDVVMQLFFACLLLGTVSSLWIRTPYQIFSLI